MDLPVELPQTVQAPDKFDDLRVVLVSPRNPLNIGAAARAMSNFGVAALRLVNPYDAAFREARSAVGAEELLARAEVFSTVAKAVADCALVVGTTAPMRRAPQHPLHPLDKAAALIRPALQAGAVALLFGSEKRGLTNEDLAHCHWLLYIPTAQQQPSMNLAQAVAVCLYELARSFEPTSQSRDTEHPAVPVARSSPASAAELERLTTVLLEALDASGYTLPEQGALTEQSARRLVRRLALQSEDAESLLGMLRQILWKLQRDRKS